MPYKLYKPLTPRKAVEMLVVFGVWGAAQLQLSQAESLMHGVQVQAVKTFSAHSDEVDRERQLVDKCAWTQVPLTASARDCLVATIPQLTDWQAARTAATPLVRWLAEHPDDAQTQEAGIRLMDQAWMSWFKDYQPAYARLDAMEQSASADSWLFRIFYAGQVGVGYEQLQYRMTANLDTDMVSPAEGKRTRQRVDAHPDSVLF